MPSRVFLANRGAARYQVRAFSSEPDGHGKIPLVAEKTLRTGTDWFAAIAQLVEHVIRNDGVTGSSPVCGTTFENLVHFRLTRSWF